MGSTNKSPLARFEMAKPLLHDHDGHVDDMISCILLWLSPEVELQAIGITNGDCFADQAFEALLKIATYLDLEGPRLLPATIKCRILSRRTGAEKAT